MPASQAVFATDNMAWMASENSNSDYNWKITNETIDGVESQVLTCSMFRENDPNAFPIIKQTANVCIQVKNAENGTIVNPKFYAWMDHNTAEIGRAHV